MDVSVSHMNNRLALQLPAQLPLGLVFVLGDVTKLRDNGRYAQKQFELVEKEHRVRCRLSERTALEADLQEGDRIRAGGHLAFDPTRADYYLLVRDVEVVPYQSPARAMPSATQAEAIAMLEDVRKRAKAAKLVQSELPPWVEKMAPSEFKGRNADESGEIPVRAGSREEVDNGQLAQLSAAMESDEDVELTSELLEVARKLNQVRGVSTGDSGAYGVRSPVTGVKFAYPTDIEDVDAYTPTGKISSDRILVLVIIVALMIFLLIFLLFSVRGF